MRRSRAWSSPRQGSVLRRRRHHHAGCDRRSFAEMARHARRRSRGAAQLFDESRKLSQLFRRLETNGKPWVAAINGTALGGGLRALPRLPSSRRRPTTPRRGVGLPEIKIGIFPGAGGTQRVRAHDAAGGCAADAAQRRAIEGRPRQGDETDRRGGAAGGPDQDREGLDQGRRQGRRALGCAGLQAARRPGLFQGGDDDLPGG